AGGKVEWVGGGRGERNRLMGLPLKFVALTVNASVWPRFTVLLPMGLRINPPSTVAVVFATALAPKRSVTVNLTTQFPAALEDGAGLAPVSRLLPQAFHCNVNCAP